MDEDRSVEDSDVIEQPDVVEQPGVIEQPGVTEQREPLAESVQVESDQVESDQVESAEPDDGMPIEDPRVIAAVERLADLEGLPVAEQVEIFADIHARLTEALGTDPSPTASA